MHISLIATGNISTGFGELKLRHSMAVSIILSAGTSLDPRWTGSSIGPIDTCVSQKTISVPSDRDRGDL